MMRTKLPLLLAIAGCALLLPFAVTASESNTPGEVDERIENTFRKTYVHKMYLRDDAITIHSKDGIVTLTGTATTDTHKIMAENTAEALPGVKKVINRIEIAGEQPAMQSDGWLMGKVKANLLFHRNVSVTKTTVEVKDGIVTLRGEASSQAQKDLTTEYAKDVEGVKSVINEMTVVPDTSKQDVTETVSEAIDDVSISVQAKIMLASHRSTSAIRTKIEVHDGTVTLRGKAKNAAEKDLVSKLVNDINGVTKVVNEMTIDPNA